ncbi:hypothetical protein O181_018500 [Austropuccinia psidii MF-1]|uniref:Uncharacterized protein n=1 Tax=Austropuccinia psidii MF-1 TaxID=1389203 RepID=A0A9Q3C9Y8_9BASI|nr:hypothetical protein [Austropuccinia psidii MF-1]
MIKMTLEYPRDIGIPNYQPEEITRARKGRSSRNRYNDQRWKEIERNPPNHAIAPHVEQRSSTRRLEGPGPSSSNLPTPQENVPMEHGEEKINLRNIIGKNWHHHPETMSQGHDLGGIDSENQWLEPQQKEQVSGKKGSFLLNTIGTSFKITKKINNDNKGKDSYKIYNF